MLFSGFSSPLSFHTEVMLMMMMMMMMTEILTVNQFCCSETLWRAGIQWAAGPCHWN